ncbi:hypothetical protein IAQ61_009368 [Plenodomus lingam]|uniref:uncharacterized protein n=1 Tax=Leptosphaeria maculans TaxID=5022 RepID=UPI00332CFF41|nr:hypothetical protein IAQ61_009368 [Plenodomus lingam]
MSTSSETSGSAPKEDEDTQSASSHQSTSMQLQLAQDNKKSKRYVAPQPDAHTFASQQEFLDSLAPITVDQVENDNLKCPICWKVYCEAPDPGYNNSELPVRLKCQHVFGQKCLATTFGMPEDSRRELRPLSFSPGSRGAALGHRLHTYLTEHAHGFEDKHDGLHNVAQALSQMMQDAHVPGQGILLFGDFWWPILQLIGSPATRSRRQITFMENAVILDHGLTSDLWTTTSSAPGVPKPAAVSWQSADWNQPLGQAISAFPTFTTQVSSSSNKDIAADTLPGSSAIMPSLSNHSANKPTQQAVFPLAMQWGPHSTGLPPPDNLLYTSGPNPAGVYDLPPGVMPYSYNHSSLKWKDALAAETNMDKLTALKKAAKQASTANKSSVKAAEPTNNELDDKQERIKQEKQKRLVSRISSTMSSALAELYARYIKETSERGPSLRMHRRPNLVSVSVRVHERDAMASEYKIPSPRPHPSYYNNEDEDEDEEEEEKDEDDDQKLDNDLSMLFFVITRTPCMSPCCVVAGKERTKRLPVPRAVRWRNDEKVPDGCPVCHKVLFLKSEADHRGYISAPGNYDGWLAFAGSDEGLFDVGV